MCFLFNLWYVEFDGQIHSKKSAFILVPLNFLFYMLFRANSAHMDQFSFYEKLACIKRSTIIHARLTILNKYHEFNDCNELCRYSSFRK